MPNISDQFVPTGVYSIRNVAFGRFLSLSHGKDSLKSSTVTNDLSDKWIVILLSSKRIMIRNGRTGYYIHPEHNHGEGDRIYAHRDPYEWVIMAVRGSPGIYQIYSRADFKLFWSCVQSGAIEFSRNVDAGSTHWTLTREADIFLSGVLPTIVEGVIRPTERLHANTFELTIPEGWTAVVSGVPLGTAINSIHLQSVTVRNIVEMVQLYNKRGENQLTLRDTTQAAYQVSAEIGPIGLGLAFFCSIKKSKRDPFVLSYTDEYISKLNVTFVDGTADSRRFPDFKVYHIISLNSTSETLACAAVTIHLSRRTLKPSNPYKPPQGTVNANYNPENDEDRPQAIDEYLRRYNNLFLIDDSGSMAGERWKEARRALIAISNEALQSDADGISVQFFNSPVQGEGIKGQEAVLDILNRVVVGGGTPTGARLDAVLGQHVKELDDAIDTPRYNAIKPLVIICLTDGQPSDQPLPVLEKWAARLDAMKHHPNAIGVQFVQIGNMPGCDEALLALTRGNVRGMVDTVPYDGLVTPERLTRILLGAIKPSVRANGNTSVP